MNPLTPVVAGTTATIVATTIVQLATLAVIAYGIYSFRAIVVHYLDNRAEPLFKRREAVESAIDEIRKNGGVVAATA